MESAHPEKVIFFLNFNAKLPQYYFVISSFLKKFSITLIPVSPREVTRITNREAIMLTIIPDLETLTRFEAHRKKYLDFALRSKRISLYHISSFGSLQIKGQAVRGIKYHYFRMPINFQEVCLEMARSLYRMDKEVSRWPGGKNFKLPKEVSS
jgi:hypothetical protein